MKNELQKHKKSDKIKWVLTGIAFVLVFVFLVGLCMQLFVKDDKYKPSEWFKKPDTEQNTPEISDANTPAVDENGEKLTSGKVHNLPKAMTFRTARSFAATPTVQSDEYASVTLQATVLPEYATNKTVTWLVAFVDPSSVWANGKDINDYFIVTPTADGSTTATARCLQPFGEQIKITVTSRDGSAITASCIVDFEQRITNLHLTLCGGKVDTSTLVGTWRLNNPDTSNSAFWYACSSNFLGSKNWQIRMEYATSNDYMQYGYRYRNLFSKTNNGMLSGLWFGQYSSPDWSITFADMTETYKDFYLYIKSVDESSDIEFLLRGFNAGLFTKVSDNLGLENTDKNNVTDTLYADSTYRVCYDIEYSDCTISRQVGIMSSICDFGLVSDFNSLIGLSSTNEKVRPLGYSSTLRGNCLVSDFSFDTTKFAQMLYMPSDCYENETNTQGNKLLTNEGKIVVSDVLNKVKTNGQNKNLVFLRLNLTDTKGETIFYKEYYFALNVDSLSYAVEDITLSDTQIKI